MQSHHRFLGLSTLVIVSTLVTARAEVAASAFVDDFNTDAPGCAANPCTVGLYTYSGFNGAGSFDIAGGTLNITVTSGFSSGTKAVVLDDGVHFLNECERFSVDVPGVLGVEAVTVRVGTTNLPVVGTLPPEVGFRVRRDSGGTSSVLRIQQNSDPGGGILTTIPDPSRGSVLRITVERLSATDFRFFYDAGAGPVQIGGLFTNNDVAGSPDLLVGVQAFTTSLTTYAFDNFEITGTDIDGPVLFVDDDAPAGGDGASWGTAYRFLQDALTTAAVPCNAVYEIRVGAGTYCPDQSAAAPSGTGDRNASFTMVDGVTVLGGFAGFGAPSPNDRDVVLHETVLTGDLADDDDTGGSNAENSLHVVTGSGTDATAILDGVTITAGNADGPLVGGFPDNSGGGMLNVAGSPTLANCIFDGNYAHNGAGMRNLDSNPSLMNCAFVQNVGTNDGGGMGNVRSSPTITDCVFQENSVAGAPFPEGGGMNNNADSNPTLTRCRFDANSSVNGGGMWNFNSSSPTIVDCTFIANTASSHGGGIFNHTAANSEVLNSRFLGNSAIHGGAFYSFLSEPRIINSVFSGNATRDNGVITNRRGVLELVNVTVGGNTASATNGIAGIGSGSDSDLIATNCTLYNNSTLFGFTNEFNQLAAGPITINHSLVQRWSGTFGGVGNSGADPLFVDADGADDHVGTEDDDLRLSAGSPAIDSGDSAALPADVFDLDGDTDTAEPIPLDLDGNPRFTDDPTTPDTGVGTPPVDRGAYEFVPIDLDGDGDGLTDAEELALGTDPEDADSDEDDLTDGDEVLVHLTDPLDADSDDDELDDGDEVNAHLTDPLDADTDGDGLDDGYEVINSEFGCPHPLELDSDGDSLDDGLEVLVLGTNPCGTDTDADGLADNLEVNTYGTDPTDEDSDDDGLFDGTEVDVAQGTGCPDPLAADSDGDTLSDGAEVTLGTDPCNTDTDGDMVTDDIDDLPTEPGVSSGFIEDDLRALCEYVRDLDLEHFAAPNNNAKKGRRNAMCNKLNAAANAIADDDYQDAYDQLQSLRKKLDDQGSPPDWMVHVDAGAGQPTSKEIVRDDIDLMAFLILLEL